MADAKTFNVQTGLAALDKEDQIELFMTAIKSARKNPDHAFQTVRTITEAVHFNAETLHKGFYECAKGNFSQIGKYLLDSFDIDINWQNPENYNMTFLIRSAQNDCLEMVDIILGCSDANLNITDTTGFSAGAYVHKNLEQPDNTVKGQIARRILNDPRCDTSSVDEQIHRRFDKTAELSAQSQTNLGALEDAMKKRNAVAEALGLPLKPVAFGD